MTTAVAISRCPLCDYDAFTLLYPSTLTAEAPLRPEDFACTNIGHKQHGPVVRCDRCGLGFINPRERAEAITEAYAQVTDELYAQEEHGRVLTFTRLLDHIEKLRRPPGKLLDVGCHIGTFLRLARERGWDSFGVEPSRWAVEHARATHKLNVRAGVARDAQAFDTKFDVVTFIDVVEHVPDPLQELRDIHALLAPGGLLVLTTMDFGSLFARVTGRRWPWLMRMHLFYFTRDTMRKILERAGFEVVHVTGYTHVVSAGYLAHKFSSYSPGLARLAGNVVRGLRLQNLPVPINFGDFMTVVARACKR